ncbi:MAG TPA: hypothetical protein VFA75_06425 [Nevskia sp.]|nr:hypothetical protein [Nevskia sp.]
MPTLGQSIANLIRNLEHIRDARYPPPQALVHQIDQLYDLAVKYAATQINDATAQYNAAAQAMSDAADRSLAAINDLARVAEAIKLAAKAITLAAKILAVV